MLSFLCLPFLIKDYVIVKNGKIYRYTLGGKNKEPNLSLNIDDIERIEKITKGRKVTGLSIETPYHHDPTTFRTKTASELLEEILLVKDDIVIQ